MTNRVWRFSLVGLLMAALVFPAWASHVCSCASRLEAQRPSASSAPVRACCARRMAAKTSPASRPALKARCCCDDIRWSQAVAKITTPRATDSVFTPAAVPGDAMRLESVRVAEVRSFVWLNAVRAGPPAPVQTLLCRWQV